MDCSFRAHRLRAGAVWASVCMNSVLFAHRLFIESGYLFKFVKSLAFLKLKMRKKNRQINVISVYLNLEWESMFFYSPSDIPWVYLDVFDNEFHL